MTQRFRNRMRSDIVTYAPWLSVWAVTVTPMMRMSVGADVTVPSAAMYVKASEVMPEAMVCAEASTPISWRVRAPLEYE